ncbi:response regulator [Desulfococcaceae bacterium HSG8]|nr:response regulator [Desulfococcaceae bacterium HSG8]
MIENDRILIVEDDPGVREIYMDILLPPRKTNVLSKGASLFDEPVPDVEAAVWKPYKLTLTERGEKGIQEVEKAVRQKSPFAAAFIDMKMPGIDGAETAKRILKTDPSIKIIIVTGFHEYTPDDIIRITGREDIFYLRKPFNPEEIKQFARVMTSQWILERENESLTAKLRKMNNKLESLVRERTAKLIEANRKLEILNQEK